jgi:hypothetical protein
VLNDLTRRFLIIKMNKKGEASAAGRGTLQPEVSLSIILIPLIEFTYGCGVERVLLNKIFLSLN